MARRIVLLVFDGVQSLDVTGPLEVFSAATRLLPGGAPRYAVEIVGPTKAPIRTSSGLVITPAGALGRGRRRMDTLVVPGGDGTRAAMTDGSLIAAVIAAAARSRRVASVCTGAFVLAQAGLLDGRRATTHWAYGPTLSRLFPAVRVETDPIFLRDGEVWTSAGVTAGIDLALALVEVDHGRELAREVARWLVMYLQRPGGQSQFSVPLSTRSPPLLAMRELSSWMRENLHADLSVPALARRAHMSQRHFARVFHRDVGATPAVFVESLRVEAARQELEATSRSLDEIASRTGFGTLETLHRTFRRALGVTPGAYRRRFTTTEGVVP